MIRTIFHQLCNQRRQNIWIFVELLAVSFFLWTAIDPIYVLTANQCIDPGYDKRNLYVVQIAARDATYGDYDGSLDTDSLNKESYLRILRSLRELPEVESYCVTSTYSFPNSNSWVGTQLFPDTASFHQDGGSRHVQQHEYVVVEGSNPFHTLGLRDARTGGEPQVPDDIRGQVFISEYLATLLYGRTDVVGEKVYLHSESAYNVAGVLCNYRHRDYQQPYPLCIFMRNEITGSSYMPWQYVPIIRLKQGVDADAFEERFRREVAPLLATGNFYCNKLQTFDELSDAYVASSGVSNKLRLQYSLAGFTILCIFLGMIGTFWIRCNARRQEIGVMRSMGASQGIISRQFLIEAWLLVSIAFALMLPLLLHHAWMDGMYTNGRADEFAFDPRYAQNHFSVHFGVVSLLAYLLLLAVALLATYIPVRRAARTLPAEALKDE